MSFTECITPDVFQPKILKSGLIIFIIASEFVISTKSQFSDNTPIRPDGPPVVFMMLFYFMAFVIFMAFCAGIVQICRNHCASSAPRTDYGNSRPVVAAPVHVQHNEWQSSMSTITGQGVEPSAPYQPAQYSCSNCQHSAGTPNETPPPYNFA